MRKHWSGPTRSWRLVRRPLAVPFAVAAYMLILVEALNPRRFGWWGLPVLVVAAGFLLNAWWSVYLIKSTRQAAEALRSITGREDDPEVVVAVEALLPRFRHPGHRVGLSLLPLSFRAGRGEWPACRELIALLPRQYRAVLTWAAAETGGAGLPLAVRFQVGRAWLRPIWPAQGSRALLTLSAAQTLLFYRQRFESSYRVGRRIWRVRREPFIAFNCACALGREGIVQEGVRWLERALTRGFPAGRVAVDPDVAALRDDPSIAALLQKGSMPAGDLPAEFGPVVGPYLTD